MAIFTSSAAAKQALAATRGPNAGPSGLEIHRPLYSYNETIQVGASALTMDRVRFAALPAGARIVPHLTWITSGHGTTIMGTMEVVPVDGSDKTVYNNATMAQDGIGGAMPLPFLRHEYPVLAKESYLEFIPTTVPTMPANTAVRAHVVYSLNC
ncbi:hypothetical protein OJ996_25565 [Luteolibacter sp. GHJ8]|jgi:hypothetical protein|uniref:Uncharacterized protein n=1 Tax=Luteolibacter rhizosphaerae TaxID=2989719 RepID=A0ABT3GAX6_9BACT|nr:hypothetical protein [Luteolibacter rhizosphaerae]MCW1916983.1 hypothetical protein [Luteolibacter rhizosphaerae]